MADWADERAFRMLQDMPSEQWNDVPILVRNARPVIASALRAERAAERERCAVIAKSDSDGPGYTDYDNGAHKASERIAAAIRNQKDTI